MSHNVLCALTLFSANQHKHALLLPEDFPNSEVESKWLQWLKATLPCFQSAWSSAKHWPARARPSTSLSLLARTSPSPWTPGARKQALWLWWRRRQAPPLWGEMQRGGGSSCKGSKTVHLWNQVKWKLAPMLSLVTCASSSQPLKRGWGSTSRWTTDHPSCNQHLATPERPRQYPRASGRLSGLCITSVGHQQGGTCGEWGGVWGKWGRVCDQWCILQYHQSWVPKTAVFYLWSTRFFNVSKVTDMPVRQRVSTLNNV